MYRRALLFNCQNRTHSLTRHPNPQSEVADIAEWKSNNDDKLSGVSPVVDGDKKIITILLLCDDAV